MANVESEVTKVSFGEYSGSYEGDISTFVPTMGNAKQRSSQLGHTHQLTPELRRYSHLKLMISYIMGSGAIAGESISEISLDSLRRVFKLMVARWRSQPIKYRFRERQPITKRLESISLKSRLIFNFSTIYGLWLSLFIGPWCNKNSCKSTSPRQFGWSL